MTPLSLEDRGQRTSIGSLKGCAPALTRPPSHICDSHMFASDIGPAIRCMITCISGFFTRFPVQGVHPESVRADR